MLKSNHHGRWMLCGVLMLGLLCGCSQDKVSLDDLMADAKTALQDVDSANMQFVMDMDMNIEASGYELPMTMNMSMDGDMQKDPAGMDMQMEVSVSMLGQEESMDGQMYVVEEDGQTVTYTQTSESQSWVREVGAQANFDEIITPDFLSNFDEETLKLESTDEKINDKEVYLITGKMSSDVFDEAMPDVGSDILDSSGVFDDTSSTDVQIDGEVYLYKDSKLPAQIKLDLTDGFDELLTASLQESLGSEASCSINRFEMSMTFDQYNEISEITVPDEVINTLSAPMTIKCSGVLSGMDTDVNLSFDGNDQLLGLEMIMSMDMGDAQTASALLGQEETMKDSLGVGDDTFVQITTEGSRATITLNMDTDAMRNSALFGDVDLTAPKDEIVTSMAVDAGLVCLE